MSTHWCAWCADPDHRAYPADASALTDSLLLSSDAPYTSPQMVHMSKDGWMHIHGVVICRHSELTIRAALKRTYTRRVPWGLRKRLPRALQGGARWLR